MPDPIDMLMQDHRKVEDLFQRYQQTADPGVVEQICTELTVHAAIEEQVIYPVLGSQVEGGEAMREHAEEEHQEVKDAIAEIERLGYSSDVAAPMEKIIAGVTEHVEEEESDVFPKMREELGSDRLSSLGDELAAAKQRQQQPGTAATSA